jgi:hypothetical protein
MLVITAIKDVLKQTSVLKMEIAQWSIDSLLSLIVVGLPSSQVLTRISDERLLSRWLRRVQML